MTKKTTALFFLMISAGIIYLSACNAATVEKKNTVAVFYAHNNPCDSCNEFADMMALWNAAADSRFTYSATELNLFKEGQKEIFGKLCDDLRIPEEDRFVPMLIAGDMYLRGKENIEEGMEHLIGTILQEKTG